MVSIEDALRNETLHALNLLRAKIVARRDSRNGEAIDAELALIDELIERAKQ